MIRERIILEQLCWRRKMNKENIVKIQHGLNYYWKKQKKTGISNTSMISQLENQLLRAYEDD